MSISKKLLFVLSVLLFTCSDGNDTVDPAKNVIEEYFVSAVPGQEVSRSTLQLLASGFGQSSLASLLKYDVQSYVVTYRTTFKDEILEASGVIMLPKNLPGAAPMVSLQHGTTFVKSEAPSLNSGFQGTEFFAAAGYVTLVPDYLGYGASASLFHPYYDREHAASAVIDFIKAGKEFLRLKGMLFSEKLFLAGYSEGGYVTLATAREIDEDKAHALEVTAVAAGAGGYDLVSMHEGITSTPYYSYPSYLAFVLMSYNHTYDWDKPLSYFFRENYADSLAKYMNGLHGGGFINSRLTTHVPSLFQPSFFEGMISSTGESEFKNALANNSVAGWQTNVPIRLFHGTKDEVIPYQNSESTLESFRTAGSDHVTLTPIPGGTHSTTLVPMLEEFIPWFLSF